jgi:Sulfotransferase family
LDHSKRPILVTGGHRTGTSWVGKMLAAGGEAAYISEPLNILHRPGVMRTPTHYWYTYICLDNEAEYLPALQETLAFNYHAFAELRSLRSRKDFMRMGRDSNTFLQGKLLAKRPLIKDPFAIFSIDWFARRLKCQCVITVRHPAAFVSSLKRLNWSFSFSDLLCQPLLMRDRLEPYRRDIESIPDDDIIAQGSHLWKLIYRSVAEERQKGLKLRLVRHEDLSLEPLERFEHLYHSLGLNFNRHAKKAILESSGVDNPTEVSSRTAHSTRVNSRLNIDHWKRRLQPDEIEQVRLITAEVADQYYPPESWD